MTQSQTNMVLESLSRSLVRMSPSAAFRKTTTPPEVERKKEMLSPTSTVTSDDEEPSPQRHTFAVSKKEISRGDHTAAVVWLMREMPKAKKLELRYFTGDAKELSIEFTWQAEDGVSRSIDMEVSRSQVIPVGTTLLTVVAESCKNLRELTVYTGLERISELSLSKLLNAFSVAGHWEATLESLEISWSCVEQGTFTGMQTFPEHLKSIKFDGCLIIDEIEVNEFVARLPPVLESFQVVGSERDDDRNMSMISI